MRVQRIFSRSNEIEDAFEVKGSKDKTYKDGILTKEK
jgi:hypothetical protein